MRSFHRLILALFGLFGLASTGLLADGSAHGERAADDYDVPFSVEDGAVFRYRVTSEDIAQDFGIQSVWELAVSRRVGEQLFWTADVAESELTFGEQDPAAKALIQSILGPLTVISTHFYSDINGWPLGLEDVSTMSAEITRAINAGLGDANRRLAALGVDGDTRTAMMQAMRGELASITGQGDDHVSALSLEDLRNIFHAAGKTLSRDGDTRQDGQIYVTSLHRYFDVESVWTVEALEDSTVRLAFQEVFTDAQREAFINGTRLLLRAQYQDAAEAEIEEAVAPLGAMTLMRVGQLTLDAGTGMPVSGRVITKMNVPGESPEHTILTFDRAEN